VAVQEDGRRAGRRGDLAGHYRRGVGQVEPADGHARVGEEPRRQLEGVQQRRVDAPGHRDRRDAHQLNEVADELRHERARPARHA